MKIRLVSRRRHILPFRHQLFSFPLFRKSVGYLIRDFVSFAFIKDLSKKMNSSAEDKLQ